MKSKTIAPRAFSLIELSVVILIISILITGILASTVSGVENAKVRVTREKMDDLYIALANYLAIYKKLPCPASLSTAKGSANYGNPVGSDGSCTGTGIISSTNIVSGMIPTKVLGISPEIGEDSWGSKLIYFVDNRYTSTTGIADRFDGNSNPTPVFNAYYDVDGTSDPSVPIDFAILSTGPNRLGSYPAILTINISNSGDTDELDNFGGTFDGNLVLNSVRSDTFDDILKIGTFTNLVTQYNLYYVIQCKESGYTNWDYRAVGCNGTSGRLCNAFGQDVAVTSPSC